MFNIQKWRQKLCYAGVACFFVLIGTLFSAIKAMREFGEIECSALRVSDKGAERLRLFSDEDSGRLVVWSAREPAKSFWGKQKDQTALGAIGTHEHGGRIHVLDEDVVDEPMKMNYLGIGENGGNIYILGHDFWINEGAGINKYGDGFYQE